MKLPQNTWLMVTRRSEQRLPGGGVACMPSPGDSCPRPLAAPE